VAVLGGHASVRCATAHALWRAGRCERVVVVGGQLVRGVPGEVRKSRRALQELGIPASVLLSVDEPAPGTWEEAGVLGALVTERRWTRLAVVTSPYHCRRAGEMLRRRLPGDCALDMVACDDPDWPQWTRSPRLVRLVSRELGKLVLWRAGLRERWTRG
jgi:uncharacterized SAM-binding protein YcdF (DUF218 family)